MEAKLMEGPQQRVSCSCSCRVVGSPRTAMAKARRGRPAFPSDSRYVSSSPSRSSSGSDSRSGLSPNSRSRSRPPSKKSPLGRRGHSPPPAPPAKHASLPIKRASPPQR